MTLGVPWEPYLYDTQGINQAAESYKVPRDKVVPFADPAAIGNRALYLLISFRVDSYFQRAIRHFEPFGNKALALLQDQCAHISREDKS